LTKQAMCCVRATDFKRRLMP